MTILFELLKPKPLNKRLKTFTIKKPHPLSSQWQVFSNSCNRSRKVKTGKNIYIEIFEYFLWQMTLTVTRNKVCILCSNVGSATCHIIKSVCLPDRPEKERKKSQLFVILPRTISNPKFLRPVFCFTLEAVRRRKVFMCFCFLADDDSLFPAILDSLLRVRDRFIAGINDEHIQEKSLSVPDGDLAFGRTCQIAESYKAACRNVKKIYF